MRNAPRGTLPRDSIRRRDWTNTRRLLHNLHVRERAIADDSGVPLATVSRVLSRHRFDRVSHGDVMRVRASVERLLRALGWKGLGFELWAEYDDHIPGCERVA